MSTSNRRIPPSHADDWIYRRVEDLERRLSESENRTNPTIPVYDFLTKPNDSVQAQVAIFLNSPEADLRTVFNYPDFSSIADFNLLGSAAVVSSKMRVAPASGGTGAIWRTSKVRLDKPWQCDFDFQITGGGGIANPGHDSHGPGGDGFTFIVQNAGSSEIHGGGQDLGYAGITDAMVFEYDTYDDFTFGDISDNELAIHSNGSGGVSSSTDILANLALVSPNMKDGSIHNARVSYDGTDVHMYVDDNSTPKLSYTVDLGTYLSLDAGKGYVGFTASAGSAVQNSDIINWSFAGTVVAHLGYLVDGVWYLVPTLEI